MVAAVERAQATLARERPHDLARALDTGVLRENIYGALDEIADDARDGQNWVPIEPYEVEWVPGWELPLRQRLAGIRRALDLAEATLRFLEGAAA